MRGKESRVGFSKFPTLRVLICIATELERRIAQARTPRAHNNAQDARLSLKKRELDNREHDIRKLEEAATRNLGVCPFENCLEDIAKLCRAGLIDHFKKHAAIRATPVGQRSTKLELPRQNRQFQAFNENIRDRPDADSEGTEITVEGDHPRDWVASKPPLSISIDENTKHPKELTPPPIKKPTPTAAVLAGLEKRTSKKWRAN
jgi:hypothetical protein